jgi:hypothetical protein
LLEAQYTVSERGREGVGESIVFDNEEVRMVNEKLKMKNGK